MVLEKKSMDIIAIFFSLMFIAFGLISFGLDWTNWLVPFASISGGLILILEVQIKKLFPLHNLRKLSSMQYVTLTLAVISFINGIVSLPIIDWKVDFLQQIGGFILIMVGIFIFAEWFSNKK